MASGVSEGKQYVIDNDISNEVVEVTEMDGALLWDLLEELEEEEEESMNNNNPKEAAADHNIIEGNNYNIISDNYGHAFLKQEDDHEYSNWADLMEISSSSTSDYNYNSLLLPSDEVGGAWHTDIDDMVGINVDYYFGCNNLIGDYSHYYLDNNHGAATANSYTTTDQITYNLWEGC